jgi:hypothetical protein
VYINDDVCWQIYWSLNMCNMWINKRHLDSEILHFGWINSQFWWHLRANCSSSKDQNRLLPGAGLLTCTNGLDCRSGLLKLFHWNQKFNGTSMGFNHWIGLRENLQETMFLPSNIGFSCLVTPNLFSTTKCLGYVYDCMWKWVLCRTPPSCNVHCKCQDFPA